MQELLKFDTELIKFIKEYCVNNQQTIAVAESVTAGLLQTALASAEMASGFFQGGITVYNLGQKVKHLNVEPIHAQSCNCVSAKVAAEMATNVSKMFNSHWGIGITGYAAPVPESEQKLFAVYAICHERKIVNTGWLHADKGDPLEVQLYYVNGLLKGFVNYLNQEIR